MAKKNNNANQDYFKLGGRERPGKDLATDQKQKMSQAKVRAAGAGGAVPPPSPQTSIKGGVGSTSQKLENSRHGFDAHPSKTPVPGAFGADSHDPTPIHGDKASKVQRARKKKG